MGQSTVGHEAARAPSLGRRRAVVLVLSVVVPAAMVFGGGHRGVHMARNLLLPGAGLLDEQLVIGLAFVAATVVATVSWLRWGLDWSVAAVTVGAVATSAMLTSPEVHTVARFAPLPSAHEFPVVLLVLAAIGWCRSVSARLPLVRRLAARRSRRSNGLDDLAALGPADRSRVAALLCLSGTEVPRAAATATSEHVRRRARRIGFAARGRRGGDPFRRDHAPARAALALSGSLDGPATERLAADAERTSLGVPCSEPGWVRPLDATLAAVALTRAGRTATAARWTDALHAEFALRRGHRPAWWWTPLGIGAGSMSAWEHALTTGLARAEGWIGDDDWTVLRARALGAAARGVGHPHDERTIAAARLWLAFVADAPAAALLSRPTVRHDPLAVAIDRLATHHRTQPSAPASERSMSR